MSLFTDKRKWTIKEERDGTTWWMIRGGAFSNVINKKYPHKLWDNKEDVDRYCNNVNRVQRRKSEVVKAGYRFGKLGKK